MPNAAANEAIIVGGLNPVEGKVFSVPTHPEADEKEVITSDTARTASNGTLEEKIRASSSPGDDTDDRYEDGEDSDNVIIITGGDAARHLLPMRDDHDPALTFRGIILASGLSCFQAVLSQIYTFKPTAVVISGTFIVLIAYFAGKAWAAGLPRGDKYEARWREKGGEGEPPLWIKVVRFINPGPWTLKEHAVCSITATSASNASASVMVFAAQDLFYDLPLSATTVVLTVISIGLFGYGICGVMRPIAVWHVDAVYWSTLPTVKTLQGLHWQELKNSKPLRYFWYSFGAMFAYEWLPAYIWPWLNSVSIPCLASMKATGETAAVLTNVFGGSINNEGMGLFSLSLDWQYYPISDVFTGGVLNETALAEYGLPRLTGTFAYALFMANAAIGALVAHCFLFWGGDFIRAYKSAKQGRYDDRHHAHMVKHYKETPWWWYVAVLVISFVIGLVVVIKENITLPAWAYIVSLLLGIFIAPLSTILYSRYGNGIATNNLSKMLAGLMLPGRPVGNMYFAAWSHNVISNAVTLCNDLKMGEYLKIPPRVMFLTQIYGTILGGFINYAVMIGIVNGNRDLLVNSNGNSSWSGATMQSYNTNATSWALASYLYGSGGLYEMVPIGIGIGAGLVVIHRIFVYFVPTIRGFSSSELNLPQFIQYAGFIPYNASQTCVIFSQVIAGFFTQFYLRNYRPRIFKDYSYLVTGAFDGASLTVLFILSFAVFGAGGPSKPFPTWWGNNVGGYYDLCPVSE
ncbi:hypothetical protein VSDG_07712 [Cytospora chrysosperma]|uniref:OPT family small oligopeptide transporter n=1 Tax=Cytospora chrysosperma TaxID=252740 RepID=A0A423VJ08_CYTCH|nr:hypothetical protein VSDG_07712 [Valsa sordida]